MGKSRSKSAKSGKKKRTKPLVCPKGCTGSSGAAAVMGECTDCGGVTTSGTLGLCAKCAKKQGRCPVCGEHLVAASG